MVQHHHQNHHVVGSTNPVEDGKDGFNHHQDHSIEQSTTSDNLHIPITSSPTTPASRFIPSESGSFKARRLSMPAAMPSVREMSKIFSHDELESVPASTVITSFDDGAGGALQSPLTTARSTILVANTSAKLSNSGRSGKYSTSSIMSQSYIPSKSETTLGHSPPEDDDLSKSPKKRSRDEIHHATHVTHVPILDMATVQSSSVSGTPRLSRRPSFSFPSLGLSNLLHYKTPSPDCTITSGTNVTDKLNNELDERISTKVVYKSPRSPGTVPEPQPLLQHIERETSVLHQALAHQQSSLSDSHTLHTPRSLSSSASGLLSTLFHSFHTSTNAPTCNMNGHGSPLLSSDLDRHQLHHQQSNSRPLSGRLHKILSGSSVESEGNPASHMLNHQISHSRGFEVNNELPGHLYHAPVHLHQAPSNSHLHITEPIHHSSHVEQGMLPDIGSPPKYSSIESIDNSDSAQHHDSNKSIESSESVTKSTNSGCSQSASGFTSSETSSEEITSSDNNDNSAFHSSRESSSKENRVHTDSMDKTTDADDDDSASSPQQSAHVEDVFLTNKFVQVFIEFLDQLSISKQSLAGCAGTRQSSCSMMGDDSDIARTTSINDEVGIRCIPGMDWSAKVSAFPLTNYWVSVAREYLEPRMLEGTNKVLLTHIITLIKLYNTHVVNSEHPEETLLVVIETNENHSFVAVEETFPYYYSGLVPNQHLVFTYHGDVVIGYVEQYVERRENRIHVTRTRFY